jgi:protein-S-isoprenylcysteine O-methyltransferase Ste14
MDAVSSTVTSAEAVMLAVWIVWWVLWLAAAAWSDRATKSPPLRSHILYRLFPALGGALLLGRFGGPHGLLLLWRAPDLVSWAMVAVAIGGFAFTWWARIHLGRLWSSSVSRKADHHIIDSGPYGLVRHPIYTGIIVASVATAVQRGTAEAWLGMALMTLGWYIKARLEERFLRSELGAESYDAYARRVPMLMPFAAAGSAQLPATTPRHR